MAVRKSFIILQSLDHAWWFKCAATSRRLGNRGYIGRRGVLHYAATVPSKLLPGSLIRVSMAVAWT